MTDKKEPLFKDGDKAMLVSAPQWAGPRRLTAVTIGKVHKSGRLVLEGSKDQWRRCIGYGGEPDYFAKCSGRGYETLYQWSDDLAAEINAECLAAKNRRLVNKIGDALSRIRDDKTAAKLWSVMPKDLKDLIEETQ